MTTAERGATAGTRSEEEAACPVPHAPHTPLPPGHPPTLSAEPSSLRPPPGEHCIFYRTSDDSSPAPDDRKREQEIAESVPTFEDTQKQAKASGVDAESLLVLSSRTSQLALLQTEMVKGALEKRYGQTSPVFTGQDDQAPYTHWLRDVLASVSVQDENKTLHVRPMSFPIQTMSTAGDVNLRSPLYVIGGEGRAIWTKELEVALKEGGVDAIVHSLKDVPTSLPEGLEIAAILEREDPRDALVVKTSLPYKSLGEMPKGSVIGTSSVRRVALLRRSYPHLVFSDVRGNINTRLAKLDAEKGPYTALVLAAAGLKRMDLWKRITAYLAAPELLHSVGQGSLAIEVRTPKAGADAHFDRDARIRKIVHSIGHWRATLRAEAERSLLRRLEGGCSIPLGVETIFNDHNDVERLRNEQLEAPAEQESPLIATDFVCEPMIPPSGRSITLRAVIVSLDGKLSCTHEATRLCRNVQDAIDLGCEVADDLEHRQNAREILAEVERHRKLAEEADNLRRQQKQSDTLAVPGGKHKDAAESVLEPPVKKAKPLEEIDRRGLPRDDGEMKAWEV